MTSLKPFVNRRDSVLLWSDGRLKGLELPSRQPPSQIEPCFPSLGEELGPDTLMEGPAYPKDDCIPRIGDNWGFQVLHLVVSQT